MYKYKELSDLQSSKNILFFFKILFQHRVHLNIQEHSWLIHAIHWMWSTIRLRFLSTGCLQNTPTASWHRTSSTNHAVWMDLGMRTFGNPHKISTCQTKAEQTQTEFITLRYISFCNIHIKQNKQDWVDFVVISNLLMIWPSHAFNTNMYSLQVAACTLKGCSNTSDIVSANTRSKYITQGRKLLTI